MPIHTPFAKVKHRLKDSCSFVVRFPSRPNKWGYTLTTSKGVCLDLVLLDVVFCLEVLRTVLADLPIITALPNTSVEDEVESCFHYARGFFPKDSSHNQGVSFKVDRRDFPGVLSTANVPLLTH